jgi:putative inorganic carbon (hco3(-)) transporter
MPLRSENQDYTPLKAIANGEKKSAENGRETASVSAFKKAPEKAEEVATLLPPGVLGEPKISPKIAETETQEISAPAEPETLAPPVARTEEQPDESHDEVRRREKKRRAVEKDRKMLTSDPWIKRNGHAVSYAGLFLFTFVLYFRPYELFPALAGLSYLAFTISIITLIFFIPSQLAAEGNLTARPPEVNYLLLLTVIALFTMPIARSPMLAWNTFNDVFIKVVLMFIVMVNVLRTRGRMVGLMWLSIGVGLMLSIDAMQLYAEGKFTVEDYRVGVDFGGMFGNPNELALHFILFIPIAFALGLGTKNFMMKMIYWGSAAMMIAGTVVTFSRGGFLGLMALALVLAWKLGREQRLKVMLITGFFAVIFLALAPGNYGLRVMSIFIPGLDPVGSSDQRTELLKQSIWVTLRNPWGVGMGCFQIGSSRNLVTHNAYTQVSSELGIAGFIVYLMFIINPLRKLGAVERELFEAKDKSWMYYLAVGIQASIVAYMVASFFGSFAYNWFVYYPVAYAIALRRLYMMGKEETEKSESAQAAQSSPELQPA